MPRGKLDERSVQKAATNWLAAYYEKQSGIEAVISKREARIKRNGKLGNGRADGLIVLLSVDKTIKVASLEAKSSRTSRTLTPVYLDKKWMVHAALIGLAVAFGAALIGWEIGGWFLKWVVPILLAFVAGFVFIVITSDHKRYRRIGVVTQIKRYPANYQWIALPTDMFNKVPDSNQKTLLKDCAKDGIGLLKVSAGNRITIIQEPVFRNSPKRHNDFLECYDAEKYLRKQLFEKAELSTNSQSDDLSANAQQLNVGEMVSGDMTSPFQDVVFSEDSALSS